jgi:hypothetical protein
MAQGGCYASEKENHITTQRHGVEVFIVFGPWCSQSGRVGKSANLKDVDVDSFN